MENKNSLLGVLLLVLACSVAPVQSISASPVTVTMSGTINDGFGVPGATSGAAFTAIFVYDTDPALGTVLSSKADELSTRFAGPAHSTLISVGGVDYMFEDAIIEHYNDSLFAADEVPVGLSAGVYDLFGLGASSTGATFTTEGDPVDGFFAIAGIYVQSSLYGSAAFTPIPPDSADIEAVELIMVQLSAGEPTTAAIGTVTSMTVSSVPVPAGLFLLGSALVTLVATRRLGQIK